MELPPARLRRAGGNLADESISPSRLVSLAPTSWQRWGWFPVVRLAETGGLHEPLEEHLSVGSPNPVPQSGSIVAACSSPRTAI
ncbi:hypothetical protein RHA1_ro11045 (plasmid) [Rhodococcus jostii RHA1]|uniref:Uncharacterized protein n=1 Tax=Rhodococcus jostii (strain RHA1) TaxID=101510 RepID=Q0RVJ4_RHOJR|nr:hypothetical protein RHA1_ro11045 [Rhodococcus jostii RHA1]